jgi:hypothetical protein
MSPRHLSHATEKDGHSSPSPDAEIAAMLNLPEILFRYFAAQAASDFDEMADCFTCAASVRDKAGCAQGPAAIRDWAAAKSEHGRTLQLLAIGWRGEATVVLSTATRESGESPRLVEHRFQLENGKIANLELS